MSSHTRTEDLFFSTAGGKDEEPSRVKILTEANYWFGCGMYIRHEPPKWNGDRWVVTVTANDSSFASSFEGIRQW